MKEKNYEKKGFFKNSGAMVLVKSNKAGVLMWKCGKS